MAQDFIGRTITYTILEDDDENFKTELSGSKLYGWELQAKIIQDEEFCSISPILQSHHEFKITFEKKPKLAGVLQQ